jgi:hypothetical protein
MEINRTDAFTEWDKWKKTIAGAVNVGHAVGMSDNTIEKAGNKIGNFLASVVDPENREQRLLQELWKAGDDDDKRVLTKMIVKMAQTDDN